MTSEDHTRVSPQLRQPRRLPAARKQDRLYVRNPWVPRPLPLTVSVCLRQPTTTPTTDSLSTRHPCPSSSTTSSQPLDTETLGNPPSFLVTEKVNPNFLPRPEGPLGPPVLEFEDPGNGPYVGFRAWSWIGHRSRRRSSKVSLRGTCKFAHCS